MKYKELKELRDNYLKHYIGRGVLVDSFFPPEYKLENRVVDLNRHTISWITETTQFIPQFKPAQYLVENGNLLSLAEIAGYQADINKEAKVSHKMKEYDFACGIRLKSKGVEYEYDIFGFDTQHGFLIHSKNDNTNTDLKWQPVNNQFELWNKLYDLHILPVKPHIFADFMRHNLISLKP